jgi:DNA-binding NarL/FixJ family response regulator
MIRVVVIDDDKIILSSLKIILEAKGEAEVVALGDDGSQALELYEKFKPDILLMDIRMKNVSGLDGGKDVLEKYPEALILFLTTFTDDEYIIEALHMGAKGYLLKQDFENIIPALNAVKLGQSVFDGEIISKIPDLMLGKKGFDYTSLGITDKEWELITCVADGKSNKEIAGELFLSEGTVRNYLSVIMEKLNFANRTQLAVFYYRNK